MNQAQDNKTLKATKRLIDSVWTLEYRIVNGKAEIVRYSREDQEGYDRERELPQCTIIETVARVARGVVIRPVFKPFDSFVKEGEDSVEIYVVANPKHIFDYNG